MAIIQREPEPTASEEKLAEDLIKGVVEADDARLDLSDLPEERKKDIERRLKQRQRSIFNTDGACGPG